MGEPSVSNQQLDAAATDWLKASAPEYVVEAVARSTERALKKVSTLEEEVERLRGLLSEWVGQHASAEDLLEETKVALEAGEGE